MVDCVVAKTGTAQNGLRADFGDFAVEDFPGDGVNGDVGVLTHAHVDDVGFVDLYFGGDDGHVRESHQEAAVGILNTGHDVLAEANRQIADDSVDRRDVGGLVQNVAGAGEHGFVLVELRRGIVRVAP